MKNAKRKGSRNERRAKALLIAEGYFCVRAAGSLGLFDLIAFNRDCVRLIQVKTNGMPRRAERERLEAFRNYPSGTRREIWIYHDRVRDPVVGVL